MVQGFRDISWFRGSVAKKLRLVPARPAALGDTGSMNPKKTPPKGSKKKRADECLAALHGEGLASLFRSLRTKVRTNTNLHTQANQDIAKRAFSQSGVNE